MFSGLILIIIFYSSIALSFCLVIIGLLKKNKHIILLAALFGTISTILSLWSMWKIISILPVMCFVAFLGIENNYSVKQWGVLSFGAMIAWVILLLI